MCEIPNPAVVTPAFFRNCTGLYNVGSLEQLCSKYFSPSTFHARVLGFQRDFFILKNWVFLKEDQ